MFYSDATAYFIILATAVTLHVAGVTDIETAAQAASALRPLAGDLAFFLLVLGILGVGLIGVPVLAGSAAYALSEAMGWKSGLERKATDVRILLGDRGQRTCRTIHPVLANQAHESAILERSDQRGGSSPLLVVIVLVASKKSVIAAFTSSRRSCFLDGSRQR